MFLLDTNVVSELRKAKRGGANPGVARWALSVDTDFLFVSAVTMLELEMGILRIERKDRHQGAVLRAWFTGGVVPAFEDRILVVDLAVALQCARLHVPDPRPERDALLAATALVHGLTMVTRNEADFAIPGLSVLNPWEA